MFQHLAELRFCVTYIQDVTIVRLTDSESIIVIIESAPVGICGGGTFEDRLGIIVVKVTKRIAFDIKGG